VEKCKDIFETQQEIIKYSTSFSMIVCNQVESRRSAFDRVKMKLKPQFRRPEFTIHDESRQRTVGWKKNAFIIFLEYFWNFQNVIYFYIFLLQFF
jgi:hypothetical protein